MRVLTLARDLSHEESIRFALDAAGIQAIFQPRHFSLGSSDASKTVVMVNDADYDRAASIVAGLQQTPVESMTGSWPPAARWLFAGVLAAAGAVALRGCLS